MYKTDDERIVIICDKIDHIYDGLDRLFNLYDELSERIEELEKAQINAPSIDE